RLVDRGHRTSVRGRRRADVLRPPVGAGSGPTEDAGGALPHVPPLRTPRAHGADHRAAPGALEVALDPRTRRGLRGGRMTSGGVKTRFRREASRWDQIYTDHGNPLTRAWDRWTRGNVRRRFERTFEIAGD